MKQYYAAEITANPIWLAQVRGRFGAWETIGVFHSRELASQWLEDTAHHYGNRKTQVWSIPLRDDKLAEAVGVLRSSMNPTVKQEE